MIWLHDDSCRYTHFCQTIPARVSSDYYSIHIHKGGHKTRPYEYVMIGFLLIDKPAGITSHDVIARLRRITGVKRIGHAGTLDPFATGLLLVGVGREATREMQKLVGLDKRYEATFVLGASSDTDDVTGMITQPLSPTLPLSGEGVASALKSFVGEIDQVPPTYAAIKVQGKKLYELAREGKPMLVAPRHVTIYSIEYQAGSGDPTHIGVTIHCSSGTYIRSIARDLGVKLGTGGYVETLRRTSIGPFHVDEALILNKLDPDSVSKNLINIEPFLARLP